MLIWTGRGRALIWESCKRQRNKTLGVESSSFTNKIKKQRTNNIIQLNNITVIWDYICRTLFIVRLFVMHVAVHSCYIHTIPGCNSGTIHESRDVWRVFILESLYLMHLALSAALLRSISNISNFSRFHPRPIRLHPLPPRPSVLTACRDRAPW